MKLLSGILTVILISSCTTNKESRIEVIELNSEIFDNTRNVRVYLPPGYDENQSYKVLYLNDGQNVFGNEDVNISQDWRVDEIVDSLLSLEFIDPLIIVGIDNIGLSERGNEYLPWEDEFLYPPIKEPKGKEYPDFVVKEVMPLIESIYGLRPERSHCGIGGFSYGGLIAVYTAMTYPEKFGFLLAETPSLYVHDNKILEVAKEVQHWPEKIYMGVGTNEMGFDDCQEVHEDNRMAVVDIQQLVELIQLQDSSSRSHINIVKCATHSFEEASLRLPHALEFLLN